MSLSKLKKRKVDLENRKFNSEWTDKYVFIETTEGRPMCLLCNECCAIGKDYNLRRHFLTKHCGFDQTFPPGSDVRQKKILCLKENYEHSRVVFSRSCSSQQRATAASLRVAWILGKKKQPFTDSETFKECFIAALDEVVTDNKMKEQVLASVKSIPMSDTSTGRRMDVLASEVFETLLTRLRKAKVMSLAVDESTDISDTAQFCLIVRFFDGDCFREDLLGLIPLEGHTSAAIIFQKIVDFFKDNGLDLDHVNMLVTDGAPTMAGKVNGLSARLSAVAPRMKSLHCLIHQSVLCAKLSGELKNTMDSVMSIINFIRSTSSLQHRLFRRLLADMSAEHQDLLLHNNVRWLSKGNALRRVCELREEIVRFLSESKQNRASTFLSQMLDDGFVSEMCFLSDIFHHLNDLNLGLQGQNKTVVDLVEKLRAFQRKLVLFSSDLCDKLLHFPTLSKLMKSSAHASVTQVMLDFLDKLRDNFAARFNDFDMSGELMQFVRDPFADTKIPSEALDSLASLHINEGALQLEIIDMQASSALKHAYDKEGFMTFWTEWVDAEKFPNMKELAINLLTMFGSTYTCESSFSHMNAIKTSARSSLTNERLHHCLRIALTSFEPDFSAIVQSKKFTDCTLRPEHLVLTV
uniref:HAT C-terminal dimerisation domain-containing protein n=1 Tax=Kryptolebias marmoratus TaxID=37003 RepID=A0A3Q3B518_KRYMA